jgi:uncharacterized protein YjbJ (UPF0337 family)
MTDENKQHQEGETDHAAENLDSVGQIIIGAIEQVGGILTGDPATRAEGEFNQSVGGIHQEANKNLTAIDENEEPKK